MRSIAATEGHLVRPLFSMTAKQPPFVLVRDAVFRHALLTCAMFQSLPVAADDARFVVTWADETHSSAREIENWGGANWQPSLGGRKLLAEKSPARLIIDTTLPRRTISPPYIEFLSGDRLCGRVLEYRPADEAQATPAHFLIDPAPQFELPGVFSRTQVRVREDFVRRIVTQAGARPGKNELQTTVGARERFRSWHWRTGGISVLTSSGVKQFAFDELAGLELDRPNDWEAWLRQLAILSPALESPVMLMELAEGSRLTISTERLWPVATNGNSPERWYHLCQPAWSLDLLAVPHRQVRMRSIIQPLETPLAAIDPDVNRDRGIISGQSIHSHCNENLHGGPLAAAGQEFASGFAVHAPLELAFELPRSARRFRTQLALDASAGSGGCARGMVRWEDQTLYTSSLLIGSRRALDSGPLDVRRGRLTLITDPAVDDRPVGADPFDIRDDVDWLQPVVEHDRVLLHRAVQQQYSQVFAPLAGWTLDPAEAGQWRLVNRLDAAEAASARFRQVIAIEGTWTVSRPIDRSATALQLTFDRSIPSGSVEFDVWLGANRLSRTTLPEQRQPAEPFCMKIDLPNDLSGSRTLILRFKPTGKNAVIDWAGHYLQ